MRIGSAAYSCLSLEVDVLGSSKSFKKLRKSLRLIPAMHYAHFMRIITTTGLNQA
jgi:hypothetical protein